MRFPRAASILRKLATWVDYGFRRQCPLCGWHDGHVFTCPKPRTKAEWRKVAMVWFNERQVQQRRDHDRIIAMQRSSIFWQGKFHSLRLENNALRKKLRGAPSNREDGRV